MKNEYIIINLELDTVVTEEYSDTGTGWLGGDHNECFKYAMRMNKDKAERIYNNMISFVQEQFQVMSIQELKILIKLNKI